MRCSSPCLGSFFGANGCTVHGDGNDVSVPYRLRRPGTRLSFHLRSVLAFNRPASKRRAPCQIPRGELIGLSSAAVQRSCRRRSLESFHAHRGPPCCATFAPIAARLSSWLKAAVASGTSRGERSNATQRRGNPSRPQYPRCYPRPSKHAQQPIRLHAGRSRVGPSPSNRHSPHSPHTHPCALAHRTARTRKPRAQGARSLVRRVPQKKFLP